MVIAVLKVKLNAPWVRSLKEKRSILKSLMTKIRNKFNVSVTESEAQDVHQTLVITVAALAATHQLADSIMANIQRYIEGNTDAEVVGIETEFR